MAKAQTILKIKLSFLVFFLLLIVGGLGYRIVQLQWIPSAVPVEVKERQLDRVIIPAKRGNLLGRHDELLAQDLENYTMTFDLVHFQDEKLVGMPLAYSLLSGKETWNELEESLKKTQLKFWSKALVDGKSKDLLYRNYADKLAKSLAPLLDKDIDELYQSLVKAYDSGRKVYFIKGRMAYDQKAEIDKIIKEHHLVGVDFKAEMHRVYAQDELGGYCLGLVRTVKNKRTGLFGVEKLGNKWLNGKEGWITKNKDHMGRVILDSESKIKQPEQGNHLRLTIDTHIQGFAEEALSEAVEKFNPNRGAVLVVDPYNGDILALAHYPSFNPNTGKGIEGLWQNLLMEGFDPGSTIKVVATSGALDQGIVKRDDVFDCAAGHYRKGRLSVKDYKAFYDLTFDQILEKSSNIGTYLIAKKLGKDNFKNYLNRYGYLSPVNSGLGSERKVLMADLNNPTDFSRMSFGYSLIVTPFHTAMAYAAIANGGRLMQPRLMDQVLDDNGQVIHTFEPVIKNTVMQPEAAKAMREALAGVVATGTGRNAQVFDFKVAGKTGTARKHEAKVGYSEDHYMVSFAGMMPAENPAFVAVVVIDNPTHEDISIGGGSVAAPVFKSFGEKMASYLGLIPALSTSDPQNDLQKEVEN